MFKLNYHASSMVAESFEIKVDTGTVRGTLHFPQNPGASREHPVVVLCRGVSFAEDAAGLFDALIESLTGENLAVVRFEHRCAELILDDFDAHGAVHDLEDAMGVVRWLHRRTDIDKSRIGLIGYSLGAIAATAVTQSLPSIARLCLLNATTAKELLNRLAASNGSHESFHAGQLPASYAASLAGINSAQEAARDQRRTIVVHGAANDFIAPEVSLEYVEALLEATRPFDYILIARADHTFSAKVARSTCTTLITEFFNRMLDEPTEAEASATAP